MPFVCYNGTMLPAQEPLFTAQNRGFKYGDGVFETIKIYRQTILLAHYHFDRLFLGLQLLKINIADLNTTLLTAQILELCRMNHCLASARVRLAVYRNDDNDAAYAIEATPLDEAVNRWNDTGFTIDIFPDVRKSIDALANVKTANYLPYILADIYCKENGLDECLVLNTQNHICDAAKANVFLIADKDIYTPALHQGCISGVLRRYMVEQLKAHGYAVHQAEIEVALLQSADEVFLTNAIMDMRWVKQFRNKQYGCTEGRNIYRQIISKLYK